MKSLDGLTTLRFYPSGDPRRRLFALLFFTALLIIWNILGYTVLGFEQAWAHPIAGLVTAIAMQFLLEIVDARVNGRSYRFLGGAVALMSFLPPAIIPGLACAMLLYPNVHIGPVVFASALAIASKVIFRAPVAGGRTQHIFNPSNLGIVVTLLLFPWVGVAPAYHFTENITGLWHWLIPGLILISGIVIHSQFTGRLPLCLAWMGGFIIQACLRNILFGGYLLASLAPMTSAAFIIFTLYMIPDPATTPINSRRQLAFGFSVAIIYGFLQVMHVVFGLFIALGVVCAIRGLSLHLHRAGIFSRLTAPQYFLPKAAASGDD